MPRRAEQRRAGCSGDERAGAVEARLFDQVKDCRRAGAGDRFGGHPRGHLAGVAVVEDGRVLEADVEAREQRVEVGAVLVLLRLAEHHETAAGGDERPDGGDLLGGEHG